MSLIHNALSETSPRTLDAFVVLGSIMSEGIPRVSVPVIDRILLHLWEQDHQADHYLVTNEVTRPGISEVCAMHPPNVSRAMRDLMSEGFVSEHMRSIRGEDRRQKTWQLTDDGRSVARQRISNLRSNKVLLRGRDGKLLEIRADEAAEKLETSLSLLQVLKHAQHEGVLNFGDIRFGAIVSSHEKKVPPSSILSGAHSTYHNRPPSTRSFHGRSSEKEELDRWHSSRVPMFVLSGIAGCGKTTLTSHWLNDLLSNVPDTEVMYYPCQPWDTPLGIATSILHRIGIGVEEGRQDPYMVLGALPLKPGARIDIDTYRRRLCAHLLDDAKLVKENCSELLVVLDDVHNIGPEGSHLFGALLQVAETTSLRLILISRTKLAFYDTRDVHTRKRVDELDLSGLSMEEVEDWISTIDLPEETDADKVHSITGGHPLAVELLELYGETLHDDWMRFLDQEILDVLPIESREILSILSVADRPVPWQVLARAASHDGPPPGDLIDRGLMLELEDGMWLHEAIRTRLLRDVGRPLEERLRRLTDASDA